MGETNPLLRQMVFLFFIIDHHVPRRVSYKVKERSRESAYIARKYYLGGALRYLRDAVSREGPEL